MAEHSVSRGPSGGGIVIPTSGGRLAAGQALGDLRLAFAMWPLWSMLGWQDILQRYRRSTLGPLWLTLSMGIMVASIGVIYATLFKMEMADYLPFVSLGFIIWGLMSGIIIDGCTTFVSAESIIKQVRMPLSLHALRIVWRQTIIFGHNFVIFIVVAAIFGVWPRPATLLVVPAAALWLVNCLWVTMVLGMISARYRDIPQIVNSIVQLAFLVTPIIWKPHLLGNRHFMVSLNPFYYFVEVLRQPLLGEAPSARTWYVVLIVTLLGWAFAFTLFRRYRWRIAYWL